MYIVKKKLTALKDKLTDNGICIAFIIIIAFLVTMPNSFFPASSKLQINDQSIYQYIGHLITIGKMPYIDAFDHKGIIVYILYAIGCTISEKWGQWLINFVFMCGIIFFSFLTARKLLKKVWSLAAVLVIYSCFIENGFHGGSPEYYSALFISIVLYILTDYYTGYDLTKNQLLFCGICCAGIFWIKHSTLITLIIFFGLIFIDCIKKRKYKFMIKSILYLGMGFVIITIIICIWLHVNHAFMEMINDYIFFNLFYAGSGSEVITLNDRAETLVQLVIKPCIVVPWCAGIAHVFMCCYDRDESKVAVRDGLVALFITLLVFSLPGRNYYHYISSLYPLCSWIVVFTLSEIFSIKKIYKILIEMMIGIMCFYLVIFPQFKVLPEKCLECWSENKNETKLEDDINKYALKGDTIAVVGFDSYGQYLATGHESATTYPYISNTLRDGIDGMQEDYKKQIKESKPAVILVRTSENQYEWLGHDILRNYYLVDTTEQYWVYVNKKRAKFDNEYDELKSVVDIEDYLEHLTKIKNCTICFAVKDIQGYLLNEEMGESLRKLGINDINRLLEHKYHTFIAIVSNNKNIYSNVGIEGADKYTTRLNEHEIKIESRTFHDGNKASILIDDVEKSINKRGVNIVVLSNRTGEVVDSVCFDTYDSEIPCLR